MTETKQCAPFGMWDYEPDEVWESLMRCPACKGFLSRYFPIDKQFQCKRCGAVLETIPGNEEGDGKDYEYGGRLCVVPDYAVKILVVGYPIKRVKRVKKKTNLRAMGHTWTRRVWEDEKGDQFIEIGRETSIPLSDPRILRTVEDVH